MHPQHLIRTDKARLLAIYRRLHRHFGPQRWWPGETPFEVMVGAILTQNTAWKNVERAIANLKMEGCLDARRLNALSHEELARFIRPAGYFNVKARRLKQFVGWFVDNYDGNVSLMSCQPMETLRSQLLNIKGIGPETADSILLYAVGKPVFVIDAYTRRVAVRHGIAERNASYTELQCVFSKSGNGLSSAQKVKLWNEYHAQLVAVGKSYCRAGRPRCHLCPLRPLLPRAPSAGGSLA